MEFHTIKPLKDFRFNLVVNNKTLSTVSPTRAKALSNLSHTIANLSIEDKEPFQDAFVDDKLKLNFYLPPLMVTSNVRVLVQENKYHLNLADESKVKIESLIHNLKKEMADIYSSKRVDELAVHRNQLLSEDLVSLLSLAEQLDPNFRN